jgi:uncharacterized protein YydD (DUF2326 family)
MLHSLNANSDDFQEVTFGPGMNLILAERAPGASEQHSRNARGKTSLIQAINYCLGGNRPSAFRPLADDSWEFTLGMDIFGTEIRVKRSLQGGSRVHVESLGSAVPRILLEYMRDDGTVSLQDWKFLLGLGMFSLDEEPVEHGLSSRTLLSYVVRLDAPRDPTKIMSQQPAWSSRQHVAFLIGLDWHYTYQLARMEKDKQTFEAIQYAADERLAPQIVGNESQLVLERSVAEREWEHLSQQLRSFELLDDPEGVFAETNELAVALNELTDAQVLDRRLLSLYEESLDQPEVESGGDDGSVTQLFDELGLAFTREALLRFDQVAEFHQVIISNRRRFLANEIERLRQAVAEREVRVNELNSRRTSLMRQLSSGGGVADLLELQRRESEAKAKLASIDESIRAVRSIQASRDALSVRQATTRLDARSDLDKARTYLDSINVRFDSMIRRLYDRSGSINVEIDDLGYKFSVRVSGSSSSGVTRMQLLCFDLALMAQSPRNHHPHFLVHDSVVFDGVDPRQIAAGLTLAGEVAEEVGGQYIATLNSNDVPQQIKNAAWYSKAVRRIILDIEDGGAFGRAF